MSVPNHTQDILDTLVQHLPPLTEEQRKAILSGLRLAYGHGKRTGFTEGQNDGASRYAARNHDMGQ